VKIQQVQIHNFRSIKDVTFKLDNYSLLVGENNAGKTTIITAIRMFYAERGLAFSDERDFPKFATNDKECWVEIKFITTDDEQETLKEEYRSADKILTVRKYLKSDTKDYKNNLYAYEDGELTHTNQFYGSTNVGQGKLGKILYIPALSKTDDGLKMSGPSPLRDMVNFVFEKVIEKSPSYKGLSDAFEVFNEAVGKEENEDGFSLANLTEDINNEIGQFGLGFGLGVNTIKPTDIVKNLISHTFKDFNLNSNIDDVSALGQGVQRHLIYTLIKLSSKYTEKKKERKKDFTPELTVILFEEPEAFLHPSQQEQLNLSLRVLAQEDDQQILITTHSATFVSKNILEIKNIARVNKEKGQTQIYQISDQQLSDLLDENQGLYNHFCNLLNNPTTDAGFKKKILEKGLADSMPDHSKQLEQESMRYLLWLDAERASLFFAKHIVICEGATEKVFIDYLLHEDWKDLKVLHIYLLDALGKYNIHRFMNLLGALGVKHSIFMDKDLDKDIHKEINSFIVNHQNRFTKGIHMFDEDLEVFFGIQKPEKRKDMKPINIMMYHKKGLIDAIKLVEFRQIYENQINK